MNKQILLTVNSGLLAVDAKIVGKLAVHDPPSLDNMLEHRVSHIKSGCLITAFTSYSDAVDFARKANKLIDYDAYAECLADEGIRATRAKFGAAAKQIKKLRDSYSSYIPKFQISSGEFNRGRLKTRLKNS